ncbi:hypothetical protein [Halorubrum sp. FL23]|uniref:hypothetical protein n=1 Tax=Halorubrum sp. FL23 TaxID=3458704 RepID=UPI004033DCAE
MSRSWPFAWGLAAVTFGGGQLASSGDPATFAAGGGTVAVEAGIVARLAQRPEQRSQQRYGTGEEMNQ